jgi:hypothetical protein
VVIIPHDHWNETAHGWAKALQRSRNLILDGATVVTVGLKGPAGLRGRPLDCLTYALADFVGSVQPGATDGVAFDGGDHVVEGEAGGQGGGLVEGEELEDIGVGSL